MGAIKISVLDTTSGQTRILPHFMELTMSGSINSGQPMDCSINTLGDEYILNPGSIVTILEDGVARFQGRVQELSKNAKGLYSISLLDQRTELQNANFDKRQLGETGSEHFSRLCVRSNIPHRVVHPSMAGLPAKQFQEDTIMSMILDSIQYSDVFDRTKYIIRDNGGVLEWLDTTKLTTDFMIGSKGGITLDWDYTISITETFSAVRISRDNRETGSVDVWMFTDDKLIQRIGNRQKNVKVDDRWTTEQIMNYGDGLLAAFSMPRRGVVAECIGNFDLQVGDLITVFIEDPFINHTTWVDRITHSVSGGRHTMSVEFEVALD